MKRDRWVSGVMVGRDVTAQIGCTHCLMCSGATRVQLEQATREIILGFPNIRGLAGSTQCNTAYSNSSNSWLCFLPCDSLLVYGVAWRTRPGSWFSWKTNFLQKGSFSTWSVAPLGPAQISMLKESKIANEVMLSVVRKLACTRVLTISVTTAHLLAKDINLCWNHSS